MPIGLHAMLDKSANNPATGGLSTFQQLAFIGLVVLLVASVAARAMYLSTHETQAPPGTHSALQPDNYLATGVHSKEPTGDVKGAPKGAAKGDPTGAPEPEPSPLEMSLPYVTEGSLFGLIGFALGYATRKVFKFTLFAIALAFVTIQALTHFKVMTVEWGPVVTWINNSLFNLAHDETVTGFFTKRVPSIAAMGGCYFLGFKRV
jgi:uncharacterized membrane protein (Fun14 family)